MKNTILRAVSASLIASSMLLPSFADYQVGDTVDYVLYTDIVTFINGAKIDSYNINNYTAVVAEDLAGYGFDVIWDGEARNLSISLGGEIDPPALEPSGEDEGYEIGDPVMPVYYTDITVTVGGETIPGFNIGGRTIVYVDDLARFFKDTYIYDDTNRVLILTTKTPDFIDHLLPVGQPEAEPEPESSINYIPEKTAIFKEYIKANGEKTDDGYELVCDMPSLGKSTPLTFIYYAASDNIIVYLDNKGDRTGEYVGTKIFLEGYGDVRSFSYIVNESVGVRDDYSFSGRLVNMTGTGEFDVNTTSPLIPIKDANGNDFQSRQVQVDVGKTLMASLVYTQRALDYYDIGVNLTDFGFMESSNYIVYA